MRLGRCEQYPVLPETLSSSCARHAPLDEGVNVAGIVPGETRSKWSFSCEKPACLNANVCAGGTDHTKACFGSGPSNYSLYSCGCLSCEDGISGQFEGRNGTIGTALAMRTPPLIWHFSKETIQLPGLHMFHMHSLVRARPWAMPLPN